MYNPLIDAVALFSCALVMLYTRYNIVCYIPTYAPIAIIIIVILCSTVCNNILIYNTYRYLNIYIYIEFGLYMKNYFFANDDSAGTRL